MDAVVQQWLAQQVLAASGVDSFEAWVVYAGLGGTSDGIVVDGYLNGLLSAPAADRDLIARAVNVLAEESDLRAGQAPVHIDEGWFDREEAFGSYPWSSVSPAELIAPLVSASRAEDLRAESLERTGLLRRGNDEQFRAITGQAARRFPGCSSSLALITRDRRATGSGLATIGADGPRRRSYCHRAVQGRGPFVGAEALRDAAVSSDPLVTGSRHIRFYAGHPLHGPGGWHIGSLCVTSDQPRAFTTSDARALRVLAGRVQELIRA